MNGNAGTATALEGPEDTPGLLFPSLSGVPEMEDRLPKVSELMEGSDIAALRRERRMPRSAETYG